MTALLLFLSVALGLGLMVLPMMIASRQNKGFPTKQEAQDREATKAYYALAQGKLLRFLISITEGNEREENLQELEAVEDKLQKSLSSQLLEPEVKEDVEAFLETNTLTSEPEPDPSRHAQSVS